MLKLNLGISTENQTVAEEIEKLKLGIKYQVEYASIISIYKPEIKNLWNECSKYKNDIKLCSVPLYESILFNENILHTMKRHLSYGVKAMTFHITPMELLKKAIKSNYTINSRGGEFLQELNEKGSDNPNIKYIKQIIKFCKENDIEIFLGTSLRPGTVSIDNEPNSLVIEELQYAISVYNFLVANKFYKNQIECLGHIPIYHFDYYKSILLNYPLCVMGPLLTDSVNEYDDINAIIGQTMLINFGFNVKTSCMLSRKEHIGMPNIDDVEDEIKKWKVFNHIHGIIKHDENITALENKIRNEKMKQRTHCSGKINIFGAIEVDENCTMCGDKCPLLRYKK